MGEPVELFVWTTVEIDGQPGTGSREPTVEEVIEWLKQRINDIDRGHVDALQVMIGALYVYAVLRT